MQNNRLKKIREKLEENKLDAIIISKLENIFYLTGFSLEGVIFLTKKEIYFLVNFCYYEYAKSLLKIKIIKSDNFNSTISNLIKKHKIKKIGFEQNISYEQYKNLKKDLQINLIPNKIIEDTREIKDEEEIKFIKKACDISNEAFKYITKFINPRNSEKDIADEIEHFVRKRGAEKTSFDSIVATGESSSFPHYINTTSSLKKGFLIIDFGVKYKGYCSDITRTLFLNNPSEKEKKIYRILKNLQEQTIREIKEGVKCAYLDKFARKKLRYYAKYFGHNLGHGIGLEVHESPFLSKKNNNKLKENMVITIEPGIYIKGFGGIRIEDVVLVKKQGYEVLTKTPCELMVF